MKKIYKNFDDWWDKGLIDEFCSDIEDNIERGLAKASWNARQAEVDSLQSEIEELKKEMQKKWNEGYNYAAGLSEEEYK